jgi:hypothetical protein
MPSPTSGPSALSTRVDGSTARAHGWFRPPVPGRAELGVPPPAWELDPGVGVAFPEPGGVPPTEGAVPGLGVGRSDGVPGVLAPAPGAAGVPGFAPPLGEDVGVGAGTRFRAS